MYIKAYAKINLALDILCKRPDGYHEVKMVMQQVNLYDKIRVQKTKSPLVILSTNLSYIPSDDKNIAYKAAALLIKEFSLSNGVRIHIEKHIPVGAGLAGGSTDAAAVLIGMNKLFNLGLSISDLCKLGAILGADVPFCILGKTALSEGIGEKLTPIKGLLSCSIVLSTPPFSVSTAKAYAKYSEILEEMKDKYHPDIDSLINDLSHGNLNLLQQNMINVLENVTLADFPVIEEIKNTMREHNCIATLMSGSGPTAFGIFLNPLDAKSAYDELSKIYPKTFLAKPIS